MDLRALDGTGRRVSPLCLSAVMIGPIGIRDHDAALQHRGVTSAIPGSSTLDQIEGLLRATEITRSTQTLDRVDALVTPGAPLNPINAMPSGTVPASLRRR